MESHVSNVLQRLHENVLLLDGFRYSSTVWGCSGKSYIKRKVIQTLRVWTIISMHVWCLFPQVDDIFCGVYRQTHEKWSSQRSLNISVCPTAPGGLEKDTPTEKLGDHHGRLSAVEQLQYQLTTQVSAQQRPRPLLQQVYRGLNVLLCCRCHLKWIQMPWSPSLSITLTHECRRHFVQMCSN